MTHRFLHVHERDKVKVAAAIARPVSRTLISNTKAGCDRLVKNSLPKEYMRDHSRRFEPNIREKARTFCCKETPVLVATDVAAQGIHVDELRLSLFDPPDPLCTGQAGLREQEQTDWSSLSLWDD